MAYSRFQLGVVLRILALVGTLSVLAWSLTHTVWYVASLMLTAASIAQVVRLLQFVNRSGREIARFLGAVAFDDASVTFSGLSTDGAFGELSAAMTRVVNQLRIGRAEREEQAQYLHTLIAHVPVALMMIAEHGEVQLLNPAARRLFESACVAIAQFARHGAAFATGLETLKPGESAIIKMERSSAALQLKAAATGLSMSGVHYRLISLQNIEAELTAQEMTAWQTVIRVMAHEVTNSLTPITSLAATAQALVSEALTSLPQDDPRHAALADAGEALDTIARRSEGLLHFVQNHRRLTRQMVPKIETVPARRIFVRLQRLLAAELTARNLALSLSISPDTLEINADIELLDQALINLVRNAMEALRDEPDGRIKLSAFQERGRTVIAVADNGLGITATQREKVFVPFFTTKRQGSGVGLTLVRQIATVHGASVQIDETAGGGATVSIRF
ncbi:MAG: ATP-binding protein [Steroidobacteraceae bacterium]|jgi:nitrogen fixation/metabolism regulation signal transduction histidine kinase